MSCKIRPWSATAVALLVLAASGNAQDSSRAISLGDAIHLAVAQNASTLTARLRSDEAEARIRQRRADLYPSLTASALRLGREFNTATLGFDFKGPNGESFFNPRGQIIGPVNSVDIRARLSQSLFDVGAFQRVRAATLAARATDVGVEAASEDVAAEAALAYVRAMRGQAQVAARIADSVLAEELVRIAEDQVKAGTGIALDVTRARSQLASVRAQLIAARNERDRSRLELQRALSLPANATVSLTDSLTGLAVSGDTSAARDAPMRVLQRPDLQVIDAQLAAARQEMRATRAEQLPVLSAFADHGPSQGTGGAFLPTYEFGIQLSVNVFDGFKREGRVQEQSAQRRELEVRRRDLEQQIAIDVQSALLDVASAAEQVSAARERLSLAEQEVAQARDRFRAGVAGNADVINASLSIDQARTLLIDALSSYENARIALARSRGQARELR